MPSRRNYVQTCEACGCIIHMRKGGKYPKRFCSKKCSNSYQIGSNHGGFKRGYFIDASGYKRVLIDGTGKYEAEHRIIMEKIIGRKLVKFEVVHHKDGNKLNNDHSNLLLLTTQEHSRMHFNQGDLHDRTEYDNNDGAI
jgi:hypothetical protein